MNGRHDGRRAFTLVEVLVASLLMSMLVMILTMVFNQSSIAWRTGKASIAQMDQMRRLLSQTQRRGNELLPGVKENSSARFGCVQSAWDFTDWDGSKNTLNRRGVEDYDSARLKMASEMNLGNAVPATHNQAWLTLTKDYENIRTDRIRSYAVGVRSAGPDGLFGTADDISTWPDDME